MPDGAPEHMPAVQAALTTMYDRMDDSLPPGALLPLAPDFCGDSPAFSAKTRLMTDIRQVGQEVVPRIEPALGVDVHGSILQAEGHGNYLHTSLNAVEYVSLDLDSG
jgi:hypothetical protein